MRTVCPIQPAIGRVKRESENTRRMRGGNWFFGEFISWGWLSIFAHYLAERVSRAAEQRHIVAHGGAVGQRSQTHSKAPAGAIEIVLGIFSFAATQL
jgi:hypothetical protein